MRKSMKYLIPIAATAFLFVVGCSSASELTSSDLNDHQQTQATGSATLASLEDFTSTADMLAEQIYDLNNFDLISQNFNITFETWISQNILGTWHVVSNNPVAYSIGSLELDYNGYEVGTVRAPIGSTEFPSQNGVNVVEDLHGHGSITFSNPMYRSCDFVINDALLGLSEFSPSASTIGHVLFNATGLNSDSKTTTVPDEATFVFPMNNDIYEERVYTQIKVDGNIMELFVFDKEGYLMRNIFLSKSPY